MRDTFSSSFEWTSSSHSPRAHKVTSRVCVAPKMRSFFDSILLYLSEFRRAFSLAQHELSLWCIEKKTCSKSPHANKRTRCRACTLWNHRHRAKSSSKPPSVTSTSSSFRKSARSPVAHSFGYVWMVITNRTCSIEY